MQLSNIWSQPQAFLSLYIIRRGGPFLLAPGHFQQSYPQGTALKCQPMTFSSVKGTSVHLLCSSQLSDHLPNTVRASLPYVRHPSDKWILCETNTKGALRLSRCGTAREEKDRTNATVCRSDGCCDDVSVLTQHNISTHCTYSMTFKS